MNRKAARRRLPLLSSAILLIILSVGDRHGFAAGDSVKAEVKTDTSNPNDHARQHAIKVLESTILFDGHNDLPMVVRRQECTPGDVLAYDLRAHTPGDTDLARLRAGRLGAQFWSVYIPGEGRGPFARAQLEQIELALRIIEQYPEVFELATTSAEVRRAKENGKIASLLGMEGMH